MKRWRMVHPALKRKSHEGSFAAAKRYGLVRGAESSFGLSPWTIRINRSPISPGLGRSLRGNFRRVCRMG